LRNRLLHIATAILGLGVLAGCDPTRRLPEGEYLLRRNRVELEAKSVEVGELEAIIKQQPNKRILDFPFYLHLYNLRDPDKVVAKRARKDSLCAENNVRRVERGREPKRCEHSMRGRNGEPPVVLDTTLIARSSDQLRLYMRKEGFFQATVRDTVLHGDRGERPRRGPRGRQAEVVYTVEPGPMYRLRNITHAVDDTVIQGHLESIASYSLMRPGDRFDADVLDQERERVAGRLRERGYLFFTQDLVVFDADTTVGGHQVDLVMRLERPHAKPNGLAGTPEGTVYRLGQVTIATRSPYRSERDRPHDTLRTAEYTILHPDPLRYSPAALTGMVFMRPGDLYRQSQVDRTYRRLTGLQVFDRVELRFDTLNTPGPGIANARIDLIPAKEQSFSTEGFATNRGGLLGTSVSVGYRHRNLFRGMGSMQLRLVVGLEAQQSFTGQGTSTAEEAIGNVTREGLLNTMDIGPELTLRFPHFLLPLRRDRFSRSTIPSSVVSIVYNHQRRPDFTRNLGKVSFGYDWQESRTRSWSVHPLEVNVIGIPETSEEFRAYLDAANDPVLTDSYTDHLIAGMHGQFLYNTQGLARRRNGFFSRITLEWAGHPMLVPLSMLARETLDTLGNSYLTVAGIRYAEFVKLDSDLRWRHTIDPKTSLAFRVAAGVGLPYGNLGVLPFESSFFVGGANGLRAWRARSLGPGSYSAPLVAFDRIGEVRLEGNAEYRFKLVGFLEGAFFADLGNIWNLKDDPRKPGSGISSRVLSELAVGTGVGARLNFDFFIVRFDLGMQTKDPSLPPGERWLFQPKDKYEAEMTETLGRPVQYRTQFNLNLGIGYPF
jgi:hypothetical protein